MIEELEDTVQVAEDQKLRAEVKAQAANLELERLSAQKDAEAEEKRRTLYKQLRDAQVLTFLRRNNANYFTGGA